MKHFEYVRTVSARVRAVPYPLSADMHQRSEGRRELARVIARSDFDPSTR